MTNQLTKFRPFLHNTGVAPTHNNKYVMSCMDDRPHRKRGITPVIQLGASVLGLATDTLVAASIERNDPIDTPPDVLAKILGEILRVKIRGDLHKECLAEETLLSTAHAIAGANPDRLLTTIDKLATGVDSNVVDQVIGMYRRIVASGDIIRDKEVAARNMESSQPYGPRALLRNELIDSPHVAPDIIANHTEGWFDTRGAYEAGHPAYHISLGILPRLTGEISDVLAVSPDVLTVSSLVRHAVTTGTLPHPDGPDAQFDIHRYETPLHLVA